jgi:hypothetical protein
MVAGAGALALALALGAAPPDCGDPARPPDTRCGETLDGRSEPPDPGTTARVMFAVPRAASRVVFWPVLATTGFAERHDVVPHLRAALTTDDGRVGVRPELVYATGFRPTVGAHLFYDLVPGSGSRALVRFRTAGPDILLTEFELSGPTRTGLSFHSGWGRRNDFLFAGVGPASRSQLEAEGHGISRYRADISRAELRWSPPLRGPLSFALFSMVQMRQYGTAEVRGGPSIAELYGAPPETCAALGLNGPCVDPALVPGFDGGSSLAYQGARVALDLRNDARDGSGFGAALESTYGRGIMDDPTRLVRTQLELVGAIGGLDRALILRGIATVVEPLGNTFVPFDELALPAGMAGMRAFPFGRFRDRSSVIGTIEYRWLVAYRLDASLFVDNGAVAGPWFSGLKVDNFFPGGGIGLRYYSSATDRYWLSPANSGIQVAYAPESGLRLVLALAAF